MEFDYNVYDVCVVFFIFVLTIVVSSSMNDAFRKLGNVSEALFRFKDGNHKIHWMSWEVLQLIKQ